MADIGEFADRVWEQFREYQHGIQQRFNLELPQRTVGEFVREAYYASMIPDEERHPKVCLMCYRQDDEREYHFPFCGPRPATAAEIAKLAHAVAPDGHLYC